MFMNPNLGIFFKLTRCDIVSVKAIEIGKMIQDVCLIVAELTHGCGGIHWRLESKFH